VANQTKLSDTLDKETLKNQLKF